MQNKRNYTGRALSLLILSATTSAYGQAFSPNSDAREVNAFATGTDPDGTFYGSANDTYTGPITGFWSTTATAAANDYGPYAPASLPGAQPAVPFTSLIASAGVENYQTDFLTVGNPNITDGTTDLYSASGVRESLDYLPFNGSGNSFVTGRFQVSFSVSAPVQVELDQEVESSVYTDSTGYAPPYASAISEDEFTGPSVATVHYSSATTAGPYLDSSGYTTEKFILYPNGVILSPRTHTRQVLMTPRTPKHHCQTRRQIGLCTQQAVVRPLERTFQCPRRVVAITIAPRVGTVALYPMAPARLRILARHPLLRQ